MSEFGGGWLGWPQGETEQADLNFLSLAYRGRVNMINAIIKALLEGAFGTGKPDQPGKPASNVPLDAKGNPLTLTPNTFDITFPGETSPQYLRNKKLN